MLPHAHVLQEYLKTPNMLKTLTFVEVPYIYRYLAFWLLLFP